MQKSRLKMIFLPLALVVFFFGWIIFCHGSRKANNKVWNKATKKIANVSKYSLIDQLILIWLILLDLQFQEYRLIDFNFKINESWVSILDSYYTQYLYSDLNTSKIMPELKKQEIVQKELIVIDAIEDSDAATSKIVKICWNTGEEKNCPACYLSKGCKAKT